MMFNLTTDQMTLGTVGIRIAFTRPLTVKRIQETVAQFYDIPEVEMRSHRRARSIARPRQIAMYLTKQLTPKSLPDIGRRFGGRDHTTVIHAVRNIERLMLIDGEIDEDVGMLRARLAG